MKEIFWDCASILALQTFINQYSDIEQIKVTTSITQEVKKGIDKITILWPDKEIKKLCIHTIEIIKDFKINYLKDFQEDFEIILWWLVP